MAKISGIIYGELVKLRIKRLSSERLIYVHHDRKEVKVPKPLYNLHFNRETEETERNFQDLRFILASGYKVTIVNPIQPENRIPFND